MRVKPIRIEFGTRSTRAIVCVWLLCIACLMVLAGTTFTRTQSRKQAHAELRVAADRAQTKASAVRAEAARSASKDVAPHVPALRKQMLRDLNPVFASIENVDVGNTRLALVSVDEGQGITVEYELTEMGDALAVSSALNAGRATPPWKLQAISGAPRIQVPGIERKRAQWRSNLSELD